VSSIRSFDAANRLDVFAVCGGEKPKYRTSKTKVGGLQPSTGRSHCPAGTKVLGGGVSLPVTFDDDAWIETSTPGAGTLAVDDGWTAVGGVGERNAKMSVTAICGKDKLKYVGEEGTAGPSTYGEATATCPAGTRITGGGVATDGLALVALTISSPVDSADPNTKPDNAWQGEADNYSTSNQAFVNVVAICRR
jgi:hypothetical protein